MEIGKEEKGFSTEIEEFKEPEQISGGSTDVADVSWIVPTGGELSTVCMPLDTPGHSWGVTTCSGSSIGLKGMQVASKVLAVSGIEVIMDSGIVKKAQEEFEQKTEGFTYKSAVPKDRKPPYPQKE